DNLPDIIALGNTWIPEFAAVNALEPLDSYVSANKTDYETDFSAARQSVTIDGQLFGLPWYVDTRLLFYRSDLLKKAGFDQVAATRAGWDEQLAALSGAHRPGRYGVLMPVNEYEPLVAFCLQADAPLLVDDATRGGFQQRSVRDSFAYVASLYRRGFAAVVTNTQVPDIYSAFARGEFAFLISGPWNLGEFSRRLPVHLQDSWATAPLPGPAGPGASLSGGVSLCLTRASRNKTRAFAFISYLRTLRQQSAFYRLTGDLPADQAAWTITGLMRDPRSKAFYDQLQIAKPAPPAPEWERIANEMAATLERVVRGVQPLDAALARLDRFSDDVLAKRRWFLKREAGA
ncbi:MAG: extracellular solute-binding protein, partial [Alphaproteobacteria bacterium]|nr:extracellular solute-binding protein [Alphaproteobacteria bacterium]